MVRSRIRSSSRDVHFKWDAPIRGSAESAGEPAGPLGAVACVALRERNVPAGSKRWWTRLLAPLRRSSAARMARGSFSVWLDVVSPFVGSTTRSLALGCLVALGGCGAERIEVEGVVRDGRTGRPIAGARVSTADGRSTETDDEGRFAVQIEEGAAQPLTASAPERCEATERVDVRGDETPRVTVNLFDRIAFDADQPQVGFDTEVRIEVRARCDVGPLHWSQVDGPELDDERLRVEDDGRTLIVHTHPLDELVRLDDRVGIVPLDHEERAEYRFALEGAGRIRHARVVAAPLSTGLYQVATGADVYLNGGDASEHHWEILNRPENSRATLSSPDVRVPRFRPDRFGTYLIEHRPSLVRMSIQAGAYEAVPRDCGRVGCHEAEDDGWTSTVHARTFRRGLAGELGADFDQRCWNCHATGVDPGLDNGGLHHTAARLGWRQPEPDAGLWDVAPRNIRRHGSVWCSACHGPGRIVPPPYRWQYGAKLGVGVCARCHDVDADNPNANHVSRHVDEWELSAMSTFVRDLSDDDPARREGCARCHSAQGFVAWRRGAGSEVPDPLNVAPITCGVCHDAHDATNPFAVRVYDTSDPIAGADVEHLGTGAMCASCHRAEERGGTEEATAPHAPHANVLLGRGARTVRAESADGAHRWIADTCVRCHMAEPEPGDPLAGLAGGHTFAMRGRRGEPAFNRAACSGCHGDVPPEDLGVRDWDGDGQSGPIVAEHGRALARASQTLRDAVATATVTGQCGRVAADVIDHDAFLRLVDASGQLLGDCDADGVLSADEQGVTAEALGPQLLEAAYDLALLRADGSHGTHNPTYTFEVFAGIARALGGPRDR